MVENKVAVIAKTDAVGVVVDLIKIINEGTLHTFITKPKKSKNKCATLHITNKYLVGFYLNLHVDKSESLSSFSPFDIL